MNPNPDASFDRGLDMLAFRRLRVPSTTRTVTQMMSRQADPRGVHVLRLHDQDEFTVVASRPRRSSSTGTTWVSGRRCTSCPSPTRCV